MLIKRSILNSDFYKAKDFTIHSVQKKSNDGDVYYITLNIKGKYNFNKFKKLKLYRQLDDGGFFEETFEIVSSKININNTFNPEEGGVITPGVKASGVIVGESDFTIVTIKYPNFNKYFLTPSRFETNKTWCLENGTQINGTEIIFENIKHICIYDRGSINIKNTLSCGDTFEDLTGTACDGYILYDNKFCYKMTNGNGVLLNITNHKLIYDEKEYQTLIPFSHNGYDNRTFMLVSHQNNEVEFDTSKNFIVEDCRFFYKKNNKLEAHANTVVRVFNETINIEVPMSFDFSSNLYHDQLLEDYVEDIKDSYVTKPLNYEKNMFSPVYYTEEGCFDLNSIRFNIFLRKKHFFEDTMEWKLAKSSFKTVTDKDGNPVQVEVWEEDPNAFWNSYFYEHAFGQWMYTGSTSNAGDLLGDLGFDDNDVLNQNKRLGKTFIRLLFFDSKDRNTQTLLFYSTIFINTVDMYAKYINNITLHTSLEKGATQYVDNPIKDDNLRSKIQLSCSFTCFNKNNMSGSSEGYYLYLFPTLVEDGEREIYMRVEFNHAKYGQTVPMICPKTTDEEGNIIQIPPRENYTKTVDIDNKSKIMTDLNALYNDMYIPIKIKYCQNKGGYVWYFSEIGNNENNPVFNLWEPKLR